MRVKRRDLRCLKTQIYFVKQQKFRRDALRQLSNY
jgi:hypothetical protein